MHSPRHAIAIPPSVLHASHCRTPLLTAESPHGIYDPLTPYSSGIGLAAAHSFASLGMSLFLVDYSPHLDAAVKQIQAVEGVGEVGSMKVDVGKIEEVVAMREKVLDLFGEVSVRDWDWDWAPVHWKRDAGRGKRGDVSPDERRQGRGRMEDGPE